MADLTLAGSITRTDLVLSDLDIHDPAGGYLLLRDKTGPGAMVWRKTTVTSPFVAGRFVTSMAKDQITMPIGIRVTGATHNDLDQRLQTLILAFEQFSYDLTITIDSVSHVWACEAADWSIADGSFNGLELFSHTQEITFNVPRFPLPVGGRF